MTDKLVELPDGRVVAFPDTMSDADITAAIEGTSAPAAAQPPQGAGMEVIAQRVASFVPANTPLIGLPIHALADVDELPRMGGAVGGTVGMLGGPVGSVVGAAAGGAGGEGMRRVVRGEPLDEVTGYAKAAGKEGLLQAAMLGTGRLVEGVGKGLYRSALRPSMAIRREFGDVAETGVREGVPVTQGGTDKAARLTSESRARAMQMVDAAGDAAPITDADIVGPALKKAIEAAKRQKAVGENPNMLALSDRMKNLTKTFAGGMSPREAQPLKETAQDLAATAYKAQDKGAVINSLDALANKDTAAAIQKAIESRVPGVGPQNAKTRELLGLLKALEDSDTARLAAGPPGIFDIIQRIPTNPRALSIGGIVADRGGKAISRQGPNVARVLELLLSGDGEP